MLNRGVIAGLGSASFVSGFRHRWQMVATVQRFELAYRNAKQDLIHIKASGAKSTMRLLRERISLLADELGLEIDIEQLERERKTAREQDYDRFLQQHYNLSREEAAQLMSKALSDESARYGFKSGKLNKKTLFERK